MEKDYYRMNYNIYIITEYKVTSDGEYLKVYPKLFKDRVIWYNKEKIDTYISYVNAINSIISNNTKIKLKKDDKDEIYEKHIKLDIKKGILFPCFLNSLERIYEKYIKNILKKFNIDPYEYFTNGRTIIYNKSIDIRKKNIIEWYDKELSKIRKDYYNLKKLTNNSWEKSNIKNMDTIANNYLNSSIDKLNIEKQEKLKNLSPYVIFRDWQVPLIV